MNPQFRIIFSDKTVYEGNSLKGDWNHVPEKTIQSLRFSLDKFTLVLENYREYNHLIEKISIQGNTEKVSRILILGRKDNSSDMFEFNLRNGKILRYDVNKYAEFGNQIIMGWTPGIKEGSPKFKYE